MRAAETDMMRDERTSMFLRPRRESASVARRMPPTKHPRKNEDEGSARRAGDEHWRDQEEIVEVWMGRDQDQEEGGRLQGEDDDDDVDEHEGEAQCHGGMASVKTLMKVCCASKIQTRAAREAGRSWAVAGAEPMWASMASSMEWREGFGWWWEVEEEGSKGIVSSIRVSWKV